MSAKPIPAPPQQPQAVTSQRGAHRSGQNVFKKPPPPANFFASAYRTNTISDSQPPALAISQSTSDRLQLLLQSPRGLPKVQTPRKQNFAPDQDDIMLESSQPARNLHDESGSAEGSQVRHHPAAPVSGSTAALDLDLVSAPVPPSPQTRCFLPSLVMPRTSPRQYTQSDPPAIVTGKHAKHQIAQRNNINTPRVVEAKSRAAFGKIYGDEPQVFCTMQRLDVTGEGGCSALYPARVIRNSEDKRMMSTRQVSPREHYDLKPAVTPDLPNNVIGDPLFELDEFDAKRFAQQEATGEGDEGNKKSHRQLSKPDMTATGNSRGTHNANANNNNAKGSRSTSTSSAALNGFKPINANSSKQNPLKNSGSALNVANNGSFGQQQYPLYLEETMDEDVMGTGQHPEETDVGAFKRDYQLTKVIFRAAKVRDTYPCRLLRSLGETKVFERHQTVVHKLGYRRLNRDEFHNHIIDIVEAVEGSVERRDTDALFDLYDTNSSGFLDDKEIVSGFHWIMQGPDEARRIIAAYCKQFLAARNVMEAVVSLMEVEIMAKAVCETCEERYPGVTAEARNIVGFLSNHARLGQVSSLSGFVPYPLFYQVVQHSLIFGKVIRILKMDGTLPPELPRTRSPDPDREMRTMIHVASSLEDDGRRSHKFQAGQDANSNSVNGGRTDGNLNSTTNRVGLIDCTHPRFKADTCARLPNYRPTPEHDSPVWALRNGVLWLTNPTEAPTLHTRKTSL